MPKNKILPGIHVDILRPQGNVEKIPIRLFRWLLSTGRYIFIFVEAVVLIAFIARFKLDADIAQKKESIDQQIPYIQNLKSEEILIRQTQLKLSTVGAFKSSSPNFPVILKSIADQTPNGVVIESLNLEKNVGKVVIQMNATAQTNGDLSGFVAGLRGDPTFTEVDLSSISLEEGEISFTVNAAVAISAEGGQSL